MDEADYKENQLLLIPLMEVLSWVYVEVSPLRTLQLPYDGGMMMSLAPRPWIWARVLQGHSVRGERWVSLPRIKPAVLPQHQIRSHPPRLMALALLGGKWPRFAPWAGCCDNQEPLASAAGSMSPC